MRLVSTIRRLMRSLRPAEGRVARASAIFHCPSEPEAGGERDRARRLPKSGSHMTQRWRKPDSNSQSHPRERVSFGDKPTQIPKAMSWQTNGRRRP